MDNRKHFKWTRWTASWLFVSIERNAALFLTYWANKSLYQKLTENKSHAFSLNRINSTPLTTHRFFYPSFIAVFSRLAPSPRSDVCLACRVSKEPWASKEPIEQEQERSWIGNWDENEREKGHPWKSGVGCAHEPCSSCYVVVKFSFLFFGRKRALTIMVPLWPHGHGLFFVCSNCCPLSFSSLYSPPCSSLSSLLFLLLPLANLALFPFRPFFLLVSSPALLFLSCEQSWSFEMTSFFRSVML